MVFSIYVFLALAGYHEPFGKDVDLIEHIEAPIQITPKPREDPLSVITEFLIGVHQKHLSPTTGPRSNFRPTSSKYFSLAIKRHGFFKGFLLGCDRLLRENGDPWCYETIIIDDVKYKFDPTISD